jgi:hypothetical protein
MNITSTEQAKRGVPIVQPILQMNAQFRSTNDVARNFVQAAQPSPRHVGYGLPCSKCGTYYMADLSVCPICNSRERVSPSNIATSARLQNTRSVPIAFDRAGKREHLPKAVDSQLLSEAAIPCCSLEQKHQGDYEPAAICQRCYDQLQQRADLVEVALQIDLKEAAKIIYDAVWADPSDPSKTYQNDAHALLTELRERSGITERARVRGLATRQQFPLPEQRRPSQCRAVFR